MPDEIDSIPETPATASAIAPGTPDRNGVPFDPARHIAKKHPTTGRWMPKGGRKPRTASPSSGSTSSSPESTAPATAAAHSPTSSASQADSPAASISGASPNLPRFDDIDRAAASAPSAESPESAAIDGKAVLVDNVEQQANTIWRAAYQVLGTLLGAPEEAIRTGAAHSCNRDVLAAWMHESGFRLKGKWPLAIAVLTWIGETFDKPKSAEKVKGWKASLFGENKPAAESAATTEQTESAAAPAPAAPAEYRSPFIPTE